jgi:putative FmdB family regulatory protein
MRDAAAPRLIANPTHMPLYDYDCSACGRRFEVIHGIDGPSPEQCPLCGKGPVRKAFAAPAIHFKGSGWAKKERRAAAKPSTASSGDGGDGDTTPDEGKKQKTDATPKPSTDQGSSSTPPTTSPSASD